MDARLGVRPNDWNSSLIVFGDFNLDRIGDPLYEAFISTGLWPPAELNTVPRTIFDDDETKHFYDQHAWFSKPDGTSLLQGLTYAQKAKTFDFIPHVFPGPRPAGKCPGGFRTTTRSGANSCSADRGPS